MAKVEIVGFDESWNKALEGIAQDLELSLKAKLEPGGHGYDTGMLAGNIKARVKEGEITIEMPKWGWYLEWGTPGQIRAPPGMSPDPNRKYPMFKDGNEWGYYFADWARRKLGITDPKKLFPIARHIALYGTRPFPFIRTTIHNNLVPIVKQNLRDAFR